MHVIVLANQKGGVGKTTLAGHLAVEAERLDHGPVALVDTDPQGSLAAWWNERAATTPLFAQAQVDQLPLHLEQLDSSGIRLVFVDTPPAITGSIQKVVTAADLIIVPTRPSPHDLRAVGATVQLVEKAGKRMIFVVNSATVRARLTGEAALALSQHGTVAPSIIHHRVDFATAMIDGRTVGELDSASTSAREISDLWQYVMTQLRKSVGDAHAA